MTSCTSTAHTPALKLKVAQAAFDHSPIGHFRKDRKQRNKIDGPDPETIRILKERAAAIRDQEGRPREDATWTC